MHFHLEKDCRAESDCPILSLSWMGRVPNELIEVRPRHRVTIETGKSETLGYYGDTCV